MSWKIKTALQLGRVSNLPTVWSNVLAGVALAGASPLHGYILPPVSYTHLTLPTIYAV